MKYTATCDESNNDYGDELNERVNVDFKFEGDPKTYRLVFEPKEGQDFEEVRERFFTRLHEELAPYTAEEVGESVMQTMIQLQGYE